MKSTGVTPSIRDALRRHYAKMAARFPPRTPAQQELLAVRVLNHLDPKDHLDLARPSRADQLKIVTQKIINPKLKWE